VSTIEKRFYDITGALTDVTSVVFSDAGATYGVKRTDTSTSVVAVNTALAHISTGVYAYTFTDPTSDLTYAYSLKIVYGGVTSYEVGSQLGPTSTASTMTRLALRNLIIPQVSGRTDLTAVIDTGIDHACEDLSLYEWRELRERNSTLVMTPSQQYVDLSPLTDLGELRRVLYLNSTQSYPLPIWTWEDAEKKFPADDQMGNPTTNPTACYREGMRLYLVPTPSVSYNLRLFYRGKLSVGAQASDVLSVDGFDSLVVAWATAEVFESLELGEKSAARWWGIFERRRQLKMVSQRTGSGEVRRVDTGIPDQNSDPRIRDPRISWWPDGGAGRGG
jgi:hypothetical protein